MRKVQKLAKKLQNAKNPKQKQKLQEQQDNAADKLARLRPEEIHTKTTGMGIVVFQTQLEAQRAYFQLKKKRFRRLFSYFEWKDPKESQPKKTEIIVENCVLSISKAADPRDIYWENLSVPKWLRLRKEFITTIIATLSTAMCGVIIYYLLVLKYDLMQKSTSKYSKLLLLLIPIIIGVLHTVMQVVLPNFKAMEKPKTYTKFVLSVTRSLVIYRFVNSIFVSAVFFYYTMSFFGEFGLLDLIFSFAISFAILTPLIELIDTDRLPKIVKRLFYRLQPPGKLGIQEEVNSAFEDPEIDYCYKYSNMLFMVLFWSFLLTCYSLCWDGVIFRDVPPILYRPAELFQTQIILCGAQW